MIVMEISQGEFGALGYVVIRSDFGHDTWFTVNDLGECVEIITPRDLAPSVT